MKPVEEARQPIDGQQHQVVQAQAGQGFELFARPRHALRHESLARLQHGIRIFLAAHAPQQRLQFQPRAAAAGTGRVAAVFGQEHADVHLVRLALQIGEEAPHAVPLLAPLPFAVAGRALDHPALLLGRQLVPGRVARDAGAFGVAHQVVLAFAPGRGLEWLDGAGAQGQAAIRDHQAEVDADHAAEAPAVGAGADRRVEREHRRNRIAVADVALRAMQAGGEFPRLGVACFRHGVHRHAPAAAQQGQLDGLDHARALGAAHAKTVGDDIQDLLVAFRALGLHAREAGR